MGEDEKQAYLEVLQARVDYAQSKFNRWLVFVTLMLGLTGLFFTALAVIFLIHLWKLWI